MTINQKDDAQPQETSDIVEKDNWGDLPVAVRTPEFSDDPKTITVDNMFFFSKVQKDFMSALDRKEKQNSEIDIYFGDDTLLSSQLEDNGFLTVKDFAMSTASLMSRFLNWNLEKGKRLEEKIKTTVREAKKPVFVVAHGETYGDPDDQFLGISGPYGAYGADRIVRSLTEKGYDLILFWACNPDNIPLEIENKSEKRPGIIRFTLDNSFNIPKDVEEPIKFVPKID